MQLQEPLTFNGKALISQNPSLVGAEGPVGPSAPRGSPQSSDRGQGEPPVLQAEQPQLSWPLLECEMHSLLRVP